MKIPDRFALLIDASSFIHRSYHVAKRVRRRSDAHEIGAIIGFCWSLMKLTVLNKSIIGKLPTHAAIILDHRGKNFRHAIYPAYKGNRPPYEVALEEQLPMLPLVARAFGIPCVVVQGFEADDIIATLAAQCEDAGLGVVIASSDKDLCQLVTDNVIMYDAMHDKDPERFDVSGALIDVDKVKESWGVWPDQMIDLQALMGDTADNVPGVPKIGPKKAAAIINAVGGLATIAGEVNFDDPSLFPNRKDYERVRDNWDAVLTAEKLVALATNVPVGVTVDDLELRPADNDILRAFFDELEVPQLANRVPR